MGSSEHQSPFAEAVCPTPDATSGTQGIGGGLDPGAGGNGLSQVPWTGAPVPVPSNMDGGGEPFGNPARFSNVDGSTREGETLANDITFPPTRTIDKR